VEGGVELSKDRSLSYIWTPYFLSLEEGCEAKTALQLIDE